MTRLTCPLVCTTKIKYFNLGTIKTTQTQLSKLTTSNDSLYPILNMHKPVFSICRLRRCNFAEARFIFIVAVAASRGCNCWGRRMCFMCLNPYDVQKWRCERVFEVLSGRVRCARMFRSNFDSLLYDVFNFQVCQFQILILNCVSGKVNVCSEAYIVYVYVIDSWGKYLGLNNYCVIYISVFVFVLYSSRSWSYSRILV